jgi:hypothetical protein
MQIFSNPNQFLLFYWEIGGKQFSNLLSCSFLTILVLFLLSDLEPPRQRPKTSARTAQRLIAHGMGLKLPMTFGSRELKNQEETRKNRIVTRQKMKDDAWGDD